MRVHGSTLSDIEARELLLQSARSEAGSDESEVGYAVHQLTMQNTLTINTLLDIEHKYFRISRDNEVNYINRLNQVVLNYQKEYSKIEKNRIVLELLSKISESLCDDIDAIGNANPANRLKARIELFFLLAAQYNITQGFSKSFEDIWKKLSEFSDNPTLN